MMGWNHRLINKALRRTYPSRYRTLSRWNHRLINKALRHYKLHPQTSDLTLESPPD